MELVTFMYWKAKYWTFLTGSLDWLWRSSCWIWHPLMPWIVLVRGLFMVLSLWMLGLCINAWSLSHGIGQLEPAVLSGEQIFLGRQKTLLLICCSVLDWCLHLLLSTQLHSRPNRRTELGKRREGQEWEGWRSQRRESGNCWGVDSWAMPTQCIINSVRCLVSEVYQAF